MSTSHSPISGSLLDGIDTPPEKVVPVKRPRANPLAKLAWLAPLWTNSRTRYAILASLVLIGGVAAYFHFRAVPQPDYATAPMDDVLGYTLLTDEFNNLPIDKRLELLKDLIDRLKTMSGDDSAMMAAFAASIDTDKLRRQIEENASRLMLDVWDKYALDYQKKPTDQKAEYLDTALLNLEKMMETTAGVTSNKTDEERLKEARQQAKRDQEMMAKGQGPTAGQLARMADLMRNRVGEHSPPQQQQRGMQLMRDMTRHLRGQDPVTGKPANP